MEKISLQSRLLELKNLCQKRDLNRLSRRLLDFISDVEISGQLRQAAISLRAKYNARAHLAKEIQSEQKFEQLMGEAKAIMHALEEEFAGTSFPFAKASNDVENNIVVQCSGLFKAYSSGNYDFKLGPLDLKLHKGEITGIVGENGNGKTTLLRIIAADLARTGGYIHYPLFDSILEDWYQIKQNIAFIPQQLPEWKGFLKENLHFSASIHGMLAEENEQRVDYIIHRLGLTKYEDALWSEISSGYKLRFEMARALVWSPRILVIDEPMANLDINTQKIFLQDLRYLADSVQNPMAILLSSQHLHEVESIADNILFLKEGKVQYNGSMASFGKDRTENLFELSSPQNLESIETCLSVIPLVEVEDHAQYFIIRAPRSTQGNQILAKLVASDIEVGYFRDISTSTLRLFRGEN